MKPSNRIALMFALSTVLCSGAALAQDTAAPAAAPTAAAPAAAPAALPAMPKKHKAKSTMARGSGYYNNCLKENLADAEHYCSIHAEGCEAEKKGAAAQCKSEAKGERQKG